MVAADVVEGPTAVDPPRGDRSWCGRWNEIRDFVASVGYRRAVRLLPAWLVRREYAVVVRDLTRPLPPPPARVDLAWALLTERDIPELRAADPGLSERRIRAWLAEGRECAVARLDGRIAHYRWYARGRVFLPYLGRALRLEPGDMLVDLAFTRRNLRRRGVLTSAGAFSVAHARARGSVRLVALVARWNPSTRAAGRIGLEPVGTVGAWCLGPWRRCFISGDLRFDDAGDLRLPGRGA
jgi:hypothetical protein